MTDEVEYDDTKDECEMAYPSNPRLKGNAQKLRKEMTKQECHLWYDFLRHLSVDVKRQKVFGNYIVDFYCPKAKTVIELDGSQHYEDAAQVYDEKRDAYLSSLGLYVLRYTNLDINRNFQGVCDHILAELSAKSRQNVTVIDP